MFEINESGVVYYCGLAFSVKQSSVIKVVENITHEHMNNQERFMALFMIFI